MILLLALACGALNRAPRILSVNGLEVQTDAFGYSGLEDELPFTPGERLEISLEILEPDRQDFEVWWPYSPPGFDFPKDGTTGTWDVPEDVDAWGVSLDVIVTDTAPQPAHTSLNIYFGSGDIDTGFTR